MDPACSRTPLGLKTTQVYSLFSFLFCCSPYHSKVSERWQWAYLTKIPDPTMMPTMMETPSRSPNSLLSSVFSSLPVGVANVYFLRILLNRGGADGQGGAGPFNFQSNKNRCVFNKRTIKVSVSCSVRCPGTSAPSASHLTLSLFLCTLWCQIVHMGGIKTSGGRFEKPHPK